MKTGLFAEDVRKHVTAFEAWLTSQNCEVRETTNEWELVRFKDGKITSIVYFNKAGTTTWTGTSGSRWTDFLAAQRQRSAGQKGIRAKKVAALLQSSPAKNNPPWS